MKKITNTNTSYESTRASSENNGINSELTRASSELTRASSELTIEIIKNNMQEKIDLLEAIEMTLTSVRSNRESYSHSYERNQDTGEWESVPKKEENIDSYDRRKIEAYNTIERALLRLANNMV